uniref:Putative glycosyltransferase n=1 Tax=viral metagenome TaxID=1070528 RepID=A0A6M3M180_9ZZZZ
MVDNLTIFTTCRAFEGQHAIIQHNALSSWMLLRPRPEIIVFGNDAGSAEICKELELRHEPEVETTEHGIPFVDSLFSKAQQVASHNLLCYINADIVVNGGLVEAATEAAGRFERFMMTGLRWDLETTERLDFGGEWAMKLEARARRDGAFHRTTGADYFAFPRGLYQKIPDFIIGRSAWDNWLIMDAARRGIPLIDATKAVFVVHHGLTSPARDTAFNHNQKLWFDCDPARGEGSINSATWEMDESCQLHSRS